MTKIRTRFAPSPTGELHVGSVRTALFSWLFSHHHGGEFLLRIEDTDVERSTEAFTQGILNAMDWLGLKNDGELYYQSKRFDHYREVINSLLASGHAYRCYCSKDRIDALRESQMAAKEKPRYDGLCRQKYASDAESDKNTPHVIRFKNPQTGEVAFQDQVYGDITFQNSELDDLIIARTDGTPTYNLCVVADDRTMGITHVIRGEDHINNTPRQINILKALKAEIPVYAHLPMILGEDGKKLSKRHGAVNVLEFKKQGILPQALLNYIVRLGWAHGDQEVFSLKEMTKFFDIKAVNHSAAAFNYEKLNWLNQQYLKNSPPEDVISQLEWLFIEKYKENNKTWIVSHGPDLKKLLLVQSERCKTLAEIVDKSAYFYVDMLDESMMDMAAVTKFLKPELHDVLESIHNNLAKLDENSWQAPEIHAIINNAATAFELPLGKVGPALRVALTGGTVSPSLDVTIELIGQEKTLQRLTFMLKNMVSK